MKDTITYNGQKFYVRGLGDYSECQNRVKELLNNTQPCMKEPCSINGIFQPEIDSRYEHISQCCTAVMRLQKIDHVVYTCLWQILHLVQNVTLGTVNSMDFLNFTTQWKMYSELEVRMNT